MISLLQSGVNPNFRNQVREYQCTCVCTYCGTHVHTQSSSIQCACICTYRSVYVCSTLHWASNCTLCVSTNPVSLIPQNGTALHRASWKGQTAVVKVLLDHGADVHAVDKVGRCGVLLDGRVRGVHHVSVCTAVHVT